MTPETLGRYEILGELGKGAMGVVFLARDPIIGRQLALKTFRIGYSAQDDELVQFRARFLREAQSAGILNHPNIVTIHDVVEDQNGGGSFFIAMEYVKGTDLKQLMQRQQKLSLAFVLDIVAQIAEGLDYAHAKGVVHRDIKPANIIITADKKAKITDFGIARVNASNLTVEGQLLGTPNYMAPEQIMGREVDHRADLFSLGVLLYEMLTGQKPFQGENLTMVTHRIVHEAFAPPVDLVQSLPEPVVRILDRALQKAPEDRYGRGGEIAKDLRALLNPQTAAPTPRTSTSFLEPDGVGGGTLSGTMSTGGTVAQAGASPAAGEAAVASGTMSTGGGVPTGGTVPTGDTLSTGGTVPTGGTVHPGGTLSTAGTVAPSVAGTVVTPAGGPGATLGPGAPAADSGTIATAGVVAQPPPAPAVPVATHATVAADDRPSPARMAIIALITLLLGLAGAAAINVALQPQAQAPERTDPDAELRNRWLPLYREGLAMLEGGRPADALGHFDRALAIVPENRQVRQARDRADNALVRLEDGDVAEDYIIRQLEAARAALTARAYQDAIDRAGEVLAVDPKHREAQSIDRDAKAGLDRRRQARDRFRTTTRPSAGGRTSPPPPRATQPAPPASTPAPPAAASARGTLEIDFFSEVAEGVLTIYQEQQQLLRQPFDFTEKRGVFRRNKASSGRLSDSRPLAAGTLRLNVYLWRKGEATASIQLEGNLPVDGKRILRIRVDARGTLRATLE